MTAKSRSVTAQEKLYGKKIISWKALDYHPYERGIGWYISFGLLTFGSSLVIYFMDPESSAIPVASICLMAAFYLWVHRDGEKEHAIEIYEDGVVIGNHKLMPWKSFSGYWFLEDHHTRMLVLETQGWNNDRVPLLLGKTKTDKVAKAMEKTKMEHLEDRIERGFDLWSRVFRL